MKFICEECEKPCILEVGDCYNLTADVLQCVCKNSWYCKWKKYEDGEVAKLPKLTAEVFSRPDCPEWAKYAAVVDCGNGVYFDTKPRLGNISDPWSGFKKWSFIYSPTGEVIQWDASDWRNSLIERPKSLPKLTADVFDRPDCPKWAKIAVVNSNGKAYYGHYKAAEINSSGGWCGLYEERGKWERIGNELFDASDWQNSLIKRPDKLPDWCKPGAWMWYPEKTKTGIYLKITDIADDRVFARNKNEQIAFLFDAFSKNAKQARLRPYDAEEMKALVGKVVCGSEGKLFLVLLYSPNTVYFGKFSHTPEDLTLDIYKFPDGSPCGCLEHLENGDWVK